MLISSLIYALVGILDGIVDWYKIEKKHKWINHASELVLLTIFILGGSLIATLFVNPRVVISGLVTLPATFWILHDLTLNVLRKKPLDYLGTNPKKSARIDLFLGRIKAKYGTTQWDIKLVFLLISIIVALFLF